MLVTILSENDNTADSEIVVINTDHIICIEPSNAFIHNEEGFSVKTSEIVSRVICKERVFIVKKTPMELMNLIDLQINQQLLRQKNILR